ncbi:hypothetical protein EON65_25250 [archaeon]|nr:MAG: hypothetical protein EON65_25250 [archaeon]
MRVEAQRNSNGAVLRQQIFFFDPTYENIAPPPVAVLNPNAPSGLDNLGSVTGGMNDSTYAPAMAAAAGSSRIKFPSQQPGAVSGAKNAAYWQGGNANVIPNPGVSANGPKQEELLKQLFPSWF